MRNLPALLPSAVNFCLEAFLPFCLLDSVSGLRKQLQRVDQLPVREDLVVHVRAGGAAGRADEPDDVAALDLGSRLDVVPAQMAGARHEAKPMLAADKVAVFAGV